MTTAQHLVMTIRLLDTRYHGTPEWPPAPARVFQALVAGAARGDSLPADAARALAWLEALPPPVIAAPWARVGNRIEMYVPNNDADTVGGDPDRISEIRVKKLVVPRLLEHDPVVMYAWPVAPDTALDPAILDVAAELYQLGRGVDMAWAVAEWLDDDALGARLLEHRGTVHRPASSGSDPLPCPAPGSLDSLVRRHRASLERIRVEGVGNAARTLFSQPPKPRFVPVGYASASQRWVYELRDAGDDAKRWPWPLARVVALIEGLRDAAAARLRDALPDEHGAIERAIVGRKADGRDAGPVEQRVRIVPLPSIGHAEVDPAVRRVLVEVPSDCPLRATDVAWAFSGLAWTDSATGELGPFVLAVTESDTMLDHYRARHGTRRWRSVVAAALPTGAQRRRIEPSRMRDQAKPARERVAEEARAAHAVETALRHAGIGACALEVTVQREPFSRRGARAEAFASGTRFAKERLWHVAVELSAPIQGPLVIGDGRFLGLGVMAPVIETDGIFAFSIGDAAAVADREALVRALRRAVMARVQVTLGARQLGSFFSGHEASGEPARAAGANHIAIQWDPTRARLLVIAPHVLDRREPRDDERSELRVLDRALEGFTDLRAGRAGRFQLSRCSTSEARPYYARSRRWRSVLPYTVNRHRHGAPAAVTLTEDVRAECIRRRLPTPEVTVIASRGVAGRGLEGNLVLEFSVAIDGPLALGRTRYLGGGLFLPDVQGTG